MTICVRTASIGAIYVISLAQSGILQVGDRYATNAKLQALAVQRQESHATAGEVFFESYRIFSRDLPELTDLYDGDGQVVQMTRTLCDPRIVVGSIRVIAAGSSASILAGNGKCYTADSRIKHIRQYPRPKPITPSNC